MVAGEDPQVFVVNGDVARALGNLRDCVGEDFYRTHLARPSKLGGVIIFSGKGISRVAWALPLGQLIIAGEDPRGTKAAQKAPMSRAQALCVLAAHGKDETQKRAKAMLERLARRLGVPKIPEDKAVLYLGLRHHCVIIGPQVHHFAKAQIDVWVSGFRFPFESYLFPNDIGLNSILCLLGEKFANRCGWDYRRDQRKEALKAIIVEFLRERRFS